MRRAPAALAALLAVALGAFALLSDGTGEGSPPDRAAGLVPAGARLYVSADVRSSGFERLRELSPRLATVDKAAAALAELARRQVGGGGEPLREVAGWATGEAAVALLAAGRRPDWVLLVETDRPEDAQRSLRRLAGSAPAFTRHGVRAAGGRVVWALQRGFAIVGTRAAVRRTLDVAAGAARPLASNDSYRALRRRLPTRRVVTAYASNAGLRGRAAPLAAGLAGLSGAGELRAAAAALTLREGRGGVSVAARPLAGGGCRRPGAVAELIDAAPAATAGIVELAAADCVLRDAAGGRGAAGRALRRLARRAGVNLRREVVPLFREGAALLVTEPVSGPALVLLVEGAGARGVEVLSRLQPALIELIGPVGRGQAPAFQAVALADGTPALTAALAPGLELSYAAIDGRLAVSTSLDALDQVAAGGGLGDQERVETVVGEPPRSTTALVFLDLDQLLALAEETDVEAGAGYLALRDDLQKLRFAGAVVTRQPDHTTAELSFQIP